MREVPRRLVQYCTALGVTGGLLTLLGLAPFIVNNILRFYFGIEWSVPDWALFVCFAVAFGIANLRVFEGQQSSRLEFHPGNFGATLGDDWLTRDSSGSLSISDKLNISFRIAFDVYNPMQHPTSMKLAVCSIDSDWHTSTNPANIKFRFGTDRQESEELRLTGLEGGEKVASFTVTFNGPDDKLDFGYLGSLSKMIVGLTIEQRDYKKRNLTIPFDVSRIHQTIEKQLLEQGIQTVVKPRDSRTVNSYFLDKAQLPVLLSILKKYWGVHNT
jgi:hypothetical protein